MKLLRGSPAHIQAIISIDTRFNRDLREFEVQFLGDRPRLSKDDLPEDPDWQYVQAGVEERRQAALAEMRAEIVDDVGEL